METWMMQEGCLEGGRAAMAAQGAAQDGGRSAPSWSNVECRMVMGDGFFRNVVRLHFSIIGIS
jgi:hypothetical protein